MESMKKRRAFNALYKLEFTLQKKSIIWWFCVLAVLLILELVLYPIIGSLVNDMSGEVGGFQLDNVTVYFLVEGVELIGLGGALFACCFIASSIKRDFRGGQSEFLYTNGLSRQQIVGTKYASAVTITFVLDIMLFTIALIAMAIIDAKTIEFMAILSLFINCVLLHIILLSIVYAILILRPKKSGFGVAIGVPLLLYFLYAIALTLAQNEVVFVKYLTPFTPLYDITVETPFDINFYATLIYAVIAGILAFIGVQRFKNKDF